MGKRLQSEGWEPVATIQEEGETVHMLLKQDEERIAGLIVLVADDSEAVIVNLMGDLQPEMFSDTMVALDLDGDITPEFEVASAP